MVAFPIQNSDLGGLGARPVELLVSTDLPGGAVSVTVPPNGSTSAPVRVAVPPAAPLGSHT